MALNTINPNHNCFITFDIKKEELCISVAEIYINVIDPKDAFINNLILVKVSLKKSSYPEIEGTFLINIHHI